jgi:prevent-host-death family protein
MNIEIGSYEAKTKLPELLRGIQAGKSYTITLRGEPIADLVPAGSSRSNDAVIAVEQMRNLMLSAEPLKNIDRKALITEGRA